MRQSLQMDERVSIPREEGTAVSQPSIIVNYQSAFHSSNPHVDESSQIQEFDLMNQNYVRISSNTTLNKTSQQVHRSRPNGLKLRRRLANSIHIPKQPDIEKANELIPMKYLPQGSLFQSFKDDPEVIIQRKQLRKERYKKDMDYVTKTLQKSLMANVTKRVSKCVQVKGSEVSGSSKCSHYR